MVEELAAGMVSTIPVQKNQVARIVTGAQMPAECDAVIMLELTKNSKKDGRSTYHLNAHLRRRKRFFSRRGCKERRCSCEKRNSDQSRDHRLAGNIRLCRSASCHEACRRIIRYRFEAS